MVIDFLEWLIMNASHKVIVIADGHPAHRRRKLKNWLEQRKSQIELVTLPGYAPELNADKMLNQEARSLQDEATVYARRNDITDTEVS